MTGRLFLGAVGCCYAAAVLTGAQASNEIFQLVSVRKAANDCGSPCTSLPGFAPSQPSSMRVLPGGRFEARAATVEALARIAYGFEFPDPRRGVVDGNRIPQDRYDVTAVAAREWTTPLPGEAMPAELRPMLRALLEDRFQLETRIETKKIDVYAIRMANRDGKLGPGLRKSDGDCLGSSAEKPRDGSGRQRCPILVEPTRLEARAVTITDIAQLIARISPTHSRRLIVDQTGLSGTFDVTLLLTEAPRSSPPNLTREGPSGSPGFLTLTPPGATPPATRVVIPPTVIVNALESQLGLKLEEARVPLPTLVLARMKTPVED